VKNITEILQKYKETKFQWGFKDCCIFAGEIAEELKGSPLHLKNWKDFLTYNNVLEAKDTIEELGVWEMKDLPTIILGTYKKDISKVKHGDIVYYEHETLAPELKGGTLGICNGVRAYFLATPKGLLAMPVEDCLYCWSIE